MLNHQTILHCSRTTAMISFILIGSFFCLAGCTQLYKLIGLTDEQAAAQAAKDQNAISGITEQVRMTTTEIIITAIAGLGAIASGFLAKWLGTERKITKVLITGVEKSNNQSAKTAIYSAAISAGVESKLNARVKALTKTVTPAPRLSQADLSSNELDP